MRRKRREEREERREEKIIKKKFIRESLLYIVKILKLFILKHLLKG